MTDPNNPGAPAPVPTPEDWQQALNHLADADRLLDDGVEAMKDAVRRLLAMQEALDEIANLVSYIVMHGVAFGLSPAPTGGGPQVRHLLLQELGELIHRIGNVARAARDGTPIKESARD